MHKLTSCMPVSVIISAKNNMEHMLTGSIRAAIDRSKSGKKHKKKLSKKKASSLHLEKVRQVSAVPWREKKPEQQPNKEKSGETNCVHKTWPPHKKPFVAKMFGILFAFVVNGCHDS